jgi:aminoglycoside phosphotransferase family enzyme
MAMIQPMSRTAAIVEFLRRPESYPEQTTRIDVIETHFAWIFMSDQHAYKLKKPVCRGRMDYRTIAARRRVCCDELTQNRRLAPAIYLDVLPITQARDGAFVLGRAGRGRVVDWVVKMRRLPAHRMLDRAIAAGDVRKKDLLAVTARLTKFFDGAVRQPLTESAYVERLIGRTLQNQHDLCAADLGLDSHRVEQVVGLQMAFLTERKLLVGARAQHLIDGHGDLRPEHVFLGSSSEAPCVIDCLEFDADLRWVDPAEEMAFLALECHWLGAGAAERAFLSAYQGSTLTPASDALMDFYMSQSAMTRAKLAAWHLRDPSLVSRADAWRARAKKYLDLAFRYIHRAMRKAPDSRGRSGSGVGIDRPGLEQGRERSSGQHALDCCAE